MVFVAGASGTGQSGTPRHAASYWAATAGDHAAFPRLNSDAETDVLVVGAGFTGLSAAAHLQQRGYRCIVVDKDQVGSGASGRNGGIAVPRCKQTYAELAGAYGPESAILLYHTAHDAVRTLERLIAEYDIDCGFARPGHLTPVIDPDGEQRFEQELRWLEREVGDSTTSFMAAAEASREIGSDFYRGAYLEPRGAGIHPLRYCLGLAQGVARRGTAIFCDSPLTAWHDDGEAIIADVAAFRVRAHRLVLATNAYSDSTEAGRAIYRRIVPVVSSVIATDALDRELLKTILPKGYLVTDAKRLTNYFRLLEGGRLLFGGRGGASNRESASIYSRLRRDMIAIFPQLATIGSEYRWSGRVAVTLDSLPRLGALSERVFYALGYNGRGVALSAALGKALASRIDGEGIDAGPITGAPFSEVPFHAFRVPAKQAVFLYFRLLDAFCRTRPPNG